MSAARHSIRRGQPVRRVAIDRGNAYGRKVNFAWTPTISPTAGLVRAVGRGGLSAYASTSVVLGQARATAARPFTVLMVLHFPTASAGSGDIINMASGTGFRLYTEATGGGMYAGWTAQGVANGSVAARDATGVFDSTPIVLVSDWTSTGQTSWWQRGILPQVTWTDTFGYTAPTDFNITLSGSVHSPHYLFAILEGNVGAVGAASLQANPWQIFRRSQQVYYDVVAGGGGGANILRQMMNYS